MISCPDLMRRFEVGGGFVSINLPVQASRPDHVPQSLPALVVQQTSHKTQPHEETQFC